MKDLAHKKVWQVPSSECIALVAKRINIIETETWLLFDFS